MHARTRCLTLEAATGPLPVVCEVRRVRRGRYLRLRLDADGRVLLSLPWHTPEAEGLAFLRSRADWVARARASLPPRVTLEAWLRHNARLALGGQDCAVALEEARARSFAVTDSAGARVLLRIPAGPDREAELKGLLMGLAREHLPPRARAFAAAANLGGRIGRVSIRDQRSRWGSCSATGTLSLNWRLILLGTHLQDSVLWHELAHLRELNHSPAFWAFLGELDPRVRENARELNTVGPAVMALGRER